MPPVGSRLEASRERGVLSSVSPRSPSKANAFCIVLAKDAKLIGSKTLELERLGLPFVVVCGESVDDPRVVARPPIGKWDAINFGHSFVPKDADLVILNDVDTVIHGYADLLSSLSEGSDFAYAAVRPAEGPQRRFYRIANPLNRVLNIFAMGELVAVRKSVFDRLMPIPPCLAEDTYLQFKAMELGYKVDFCENAFVNTRRTSSREQEVLYKERTTLGILQALDYAKPPPSIRLFYRALPIFAAIFVLAGADGRAWAKGIVSAISLHVEGSKRASF